MPWPILPSAIPSTRCASRTSRTWCSRTCASPTCAPSTTALVEIGLAEANAGLVTDIIACPGLDYCALANARSIPIAQRISERLAARQDQIGELKIKISGCINACGHHHVGHIGILGVEKRGEEHYQLLLGGSGAEDAVARCHHRAGLRSGRHRRCGREGGRHLPEAAHRARRKHSCRPMDAWVRLPSRRRSMLPPLDGLDRQSGADERRRARHPVDVGSRCHDLAGRLPSSTDTWSTAVDGEPLPSTPVILSKKRWLVERSALTGRNIRSRPQAGARRVRSTISPVILRNFP